jgi:hypothetical protein
MRQEGTTIGPFRDEGNVKRKAEHDVTKKTESEWEASHLSACSCRPEAIPFHFVYFVCFVVIFVLYRSIENNHETHEIHESYLRELIHNFRRLPQTDVM